MLLLFLRLLCPFSFCCVRAIVFGIFLGWVLPVGLSPRRKREGSSLWPSLNNSGPPLSYRHRVCLRHHHRRVPLACRRRWLVNEADFSLNFCDRLTQIPTASLLSPQSHSWSRGCPQRSFASWIQISLLQICLVPYLSRRSFGHGHWLGLYEEDQKSAVGEIERR